MKKYFLQLLLIATLSLCTSCVSYCRIDGPYEGKVIDAETKQPLEGVVVLGVWNKVQNTVAGPTGEFYDSVELLTDKNGDFKIHEKGLLVFSNVDEMDVVIYKAGYEMLGYGPWSGFRTRSAMKFVQWDGDKPTFLLRKLSYEERKKNIPSRPGIEQKRQQLLTDEINKERIEFGYNPL
jgi:hypothetical protein